MTGTNPPPNPPPSPSPSPRTAVEGPHWSRLKLWQALPPTSVSAVIKWVPAVSSTQEIGPAQLLSLLSGFSRRRVSGAGGAEDDGCEGRKNREVTECKQGVGGGKKVTNPGTIQIERQKTTSDLSGNECGCHGALHPNSEVTKISEWCHPPLPSVLLGDVEFVSWWEGPRCHCRISEDSCRGERDIVSGCQLARPSDVGADRCYLAAVKTCSKK